MSPVLRYSIPRSLSVRKTGNPITFPKKSRIAFMSRAKMTVINLVNVAEALPWRILVRDGSIEREVVAFSRLH